MAELFVNGPIQNADFTFEEKPGRVLAVRAAAALNELAGYAIAPHLWNVVTLEGDTRFKQVGGDEKREVFEQRRISDRYDAAQGTSNELPNDVVMTDIDEKVIKLGLGLIENGLSNGQLKLAKEDVRICATCAHMVGDAKSCGACGGEGAKIASQLHLIAYRDETQPIITRGDVYAGVDIKYLSDMAGHVPNPLVLSKTRKTGIPLETFGLKDLVLDPRAGLHVAALAAGMGPQVDVVNMLITSGVAINIAAYGQAFGATEGLRLKYALHGKAPLDAVDRTAPEKSSSEESGFRNWFIPLYSLFSRQPIATEQIPRLRKFYYRIANLTLLQDEIQPSLSEVRSQIQAGKLRWLADKALLASARMSHDRLV